MDDESLAKLRAGTYKLNGKIVPKNTPIQYDELLYGDEALEANSLDPAAKKSQKIIIPITGQSLDGKFTKAYKRSEMWETAVKGASGFETKKDIIKSQLKREVPGMSEAELDKLAFETAKNY